MIWLAIALQEILSAQYVISDDFCVGGSAAQLLSCSAAQLLSWSADQGRPFLEKRVGYRARASGRINTQSRIGFCSDPELFPDRRKAQRLKRIKKWINPHSYLLTWLQWRSLQVTSIVNHHRDSEISFWRTDFQITGELHYLKSLQSNTNCFNQAL